MKVYQLLLSSLFLLLCFSLSAQDEKMPWPRVLTTTSGKEVTLYQPQLDNLKNNVVEGRMAVSAKGSDGKLVFGAVWLEATLATDMDEDEAALLDIKVTQTKFPEEVTGAQIEGLKSFLADEIMKWEPRMSLSQLKASLAGMESVSEGDKGLKHDAPDILYRESATMLVTIDGEPKFKEDSRSGISYVMNTPFFIAKEKNRSVHYLKGGDYWYQSESVLEGWAPIDNAPKKIKDFAEANAPKEEGEPSDEAKEQMTAAGPPSILVVTAPAELVLVDGTPDYQQISGTELLYVQNTESDIIMDIESQMHYLLLAGRFYQSSTLSDGDWAFVDPEDLPAGFANIPDDSPISDIKASVPGTPDAHEALLDQVIPETAEVDKNKTIEVTFDGDPQFSKVDGTAVEYALNSPQTVLRINNKYYCVEDGIWFTSSKAKGNYMVSTERPSEVDDLPPSSPVYNVKYVYIYDVQPEVIYVGYTPGYYHSYIYNGVVVYGTGFYYRPWYGYYYYPRPVTFGFGVHWNPYTGWGFSVGFSFGWVGWGFHPYYRPYWGPRGFYPGYRGGYYHGYHRGYNRGFAAGYMAGQRHSVYNNRAGVRTLNHQNHRVNNLGANRRPTNNNRVRPSTQRGNNVLTDRQGNVFQRTQNGNWQNANSTRNTRNVQRPSTTQRQQLNRTYNNRQKINRGGATTGFPRRGGRRN